MRPVQINLPGNPLLDITDYIDNGTVLCIELTSPVTFPLNEDEIELEIGTKLIVMILADEQACYCTVHEPECKPIHNVYVLVRNMLGHKLSYLELESQDQSQESTDTGDTDNE